MILMTSSFFFLFRYHCRLRRHSARYGLCQISQFGRAIWSLLILHGCPDLLVLCYLQRHHYRSTYSLDSRLNFDSVLADPYSSRLLSCLALLVPSCRSPRLNSPMFLLTLSLQPWPLYAVGLSVSWGWLVWVLLSISFLCLPFRPS